MITGRSLHRPAWGAINRAPTERQGVYSMNIGQEPHSSALGAWRTAIPKQFPDYRPHLILRNHAELHVEQRIWLRKREIPGSCARESTESTYGCHPRPSHCLPRRSRWSRTYAGYAIGKGHITPATRPGGSSSSNSFPSLSAKKAPRKGLIIQAGTGTPAPNKERLFPPHG